VRAFLADRLAALTERGLARASLAVDPGIGFGKTLAHNLALLRNLGDLLTTGAPLVVGLSRKRFLGAITGRDTGDRLAGSLAALACCVCRGAHVLRVHDVAESRDAALVAAALGGPDAVLD
jgi:dihydropteroate synthase